MSDKKVNNVDQIRDLIFGPQIKEFDERFNQLDAKIKSIHEGILHTFRESHSRLQKETERSLEVLEKRIDNLSSSTQKERAKYKELIEIVDDGLQNKLELQKDEFDTKLKITKETIEDENQKLSASLQAIRDELNYTLQSRLASLSEDKLSKESLAQMLLEVAMKIQGTDMTAILNEDNESGK